MLFTSRCWRHSVSPQRRRAPMYLTTRVDIAAAQQGLDRLVVAMSDVAPAEVVACPLIDSSGVDASFEAAGVDAPLDEWLFEVRDGGGITCAGSHIGFEDDPSFPQLDVELSVANGPANDVDVPASEAVTVTDLPGGTIGTCESDRFVTICEERWQQDGFQVRLLVTDRVFFDRVTASTVLGDLVPMIVANLAGGATDVADPLGDVSGAASRRGGRRSRSLCQRQCRRRRVGRRTAGLPDDCRRRVRGRDRWCRGRRRPRRRLDRFAHAGHVSRRSRSGAGPPHLHRGFDPQPRIDVIDFGDPARRRRLRRLRRDRRGWLGGRPSTRRPHGRHLRHRVRAALLHGVVARRRTRRRCLARWRNPIDRQRRRRRPCSWRSCRRSSPTSTPSTSSVLSQRRISPVRSAASSDRGR